MTLLLLFLGENVPTWLFAIAMICDTATVITLTVTGGK
jgi:hypothetical protein